MLDSISTIAISMKIASHHIDFHIFGHEPLDHGRDHRCFQYERSRIPTTLSRGRNTLQSTAPHVHTCQEPNFCGVKEAEFFILIDQNHLDDRISRAF